MTNTEPVPPNVLSPETIEALEKIGESKLRAVIDFAQQPYEAVQSDMSDRIRLVSAKRSFGWHGKKHTRSSSDGTRVGGAVATALTGRSCATCAKNVACVGNRSFDGGTSVPYTRRDPQHHE